MSDVIGGILSALFSQYGIAGLAIAALAWVTWKLKIEIRDLAEGRLKDVQARCERLEAAQAECEHAMIKEQQERLEEIREMKDAEITRLIEQMRTYSELERTVSKLGDLLEKLLEKGL